MDVTCPACHTRYEFDEALVSSRGTTVKCTHCGHQFKVFRPDGAADLDGWTVRTVDGRELRFKAMRELQAAITSGGITREDVLIPGGGGEPRRLGRIEELQSFFSSGDSSPPAARKRLDTPTGHHAPPSESLVKTAIRSSIPPIDRDGKPMPTRTGDTLRPAAPPVAPDAAPTLARAVQGKTAVLEDDALVTESPNPLRSTKMGRQQPDEPPTRRSRGNGGNGANANGNGHAPGAIQRPVATTRPAASMPRRVPVGGEGLTALQPESGRGVAAEALSDAGLEEITHPGRISAPPPQRQQLPSIDTPNTSDDDTLGDPEAAEAVVAAAIGPKGAPRGVLPPAPIVSGVSDSLPPQRVITIPPLDRLSDPPETPSPSAARPSVLRRSSEVYSDPRFSGYSPRGKRPTLARWVVGIVGVGVVAVVGFTFFKRHTAQPDETVASSSADNRVDKLLEEGEARLADGDVEAARDQFSRASGVTENDPRVWRALARIEVVRADLLWLELLLTDKKASSRASLEQRLAKAVEKSRAAADRAIKLAADDPLTVSLQMDVLRLEGKSAEARQLSPKVDGAGPDADRTRALLDLVDDNPNYSSVIDRLRSAARSERKLGRAQALLIYALVRAGKADNARKELAALGDLHGNDQLRSMLAALVDGAPAAAASSSGKKTKPAPPAPAPAAPQPATGPVPRSGHFELEEEPDHGAEPTPQPPSAPEPQPPAPIDTSDLPG